MKFCNPLAPNDWLIPTPEFVNPTPPIPEFVNPTPPIPELVNPIPDCANPAPLILLAPRGTVAANGTEDPTVDTPAVFNLLGRPVSKNPSSP